MSGLTSEAQAFMAWLRSERQAWADIAADEEHTYRRLVATARRDQLDTVLLRAERVLPRIEAEAVDAARAVDDRLLDILESAA